MSAENGEPLPLDLQLRERVDQRTGRTEHVPALVSSVWVGKSVAPDAYSLLSVIYVVWVE